MNSIAASRGWVEAKSPSLPLPHEDDPGQAVVLTDRFPTKTAGEVVPADLIPADTPDADYPFVLITGRQPSMHTGSHDARASCWTRSSRGLVSMHRWTSTRLGASRGDRDHGGSRRGVTALAARATRGTRAGHRLHPLRYDEAARTSSPPGALDPFADRELKYCAVKLDGRAAPSRRSRCGRRQSFARQAPARAAERGGARGRRGMERAGFAVALVAHPEGENCGLPAPPGAPAQEGFVAPTRCRSRATPFQETAWFRGIAAGGAAGASPMLEDWSQCATERAGRIGFASPIRGAVRFRIDALWPGHGFGAQALRCSSAHCERSGTKRCCCARGRPGRPRALPPLRLRGTCEVSEGEHVMRTSVL